MVRRVRVAAVQVPSVNGEAERNLDNAGRWVAEAAQRGAELVLCPEFLATGYVYDESIWNSGEPAGGLTEQWLADTARRHGIVVGASYLEAEGEHFYNTFALFGPEGLLGRVRKRSLPFCEGWFFTPCAGPKMLQTPFGKIGIGICNDNQTAEFFEHVIDERPDVILMPHSGPTPILPLLDPVWHRLYHQQLALVAPRYARVFGIPVVMTNKVSFDTSTTSLPFAPWLSVRWRFRGHSSICSATGQVLASLVDQEGVLVESVELDPARKRAARRPRRGSYWSFGPGVFARPMGAVLRAFANAGQRSYGKNPRRTQAARACTAGERAEPAPPSPARRSL